MCSILSQVRVLITWMFYGVEGNVFVFFLSYYCRDLYPTNAVSVYQVYCLPLNCGRDEKYLQNFVRKILTELGGSKFKLESIIKMNLKEIECESVDRIILHKFRVHWLLLRTLASVVRREIIE